MAAGDAKQTAQDVKKVSRNIEEIYRRREIIAFALASSFAVRALNLFRNNQSGEKYWQNQTQQAFQRVFSDAFKENNAIGFYIAHGVEYGISLELANNRDHAALRPITSGLAINFIRQLKQLYGIG